MKSHAKLRQKFALERIETAVVDEYRGSQGPSVEFDPLMDEYIVGGFRLIAMAQLNMARDVIEPDRRKWAH